MLSQELIDMLISAGLQKQQATSKTAETCVRLFMDDDGKLLIDEAQRQLNAIIADARKSFYDLSIKYRELEGEIRLMSDYVLAIKDAEDKYGKVESEKARETLALFGGLMSIVDKTSADSKSKLECASYVMWAHLGGKSRGSVEALFNEDNSTNNNVKK